jgi:hypothetical protein
VTAAHFCVEIHDETWISLSGYPIEEIGGDAIAIVVTDFGSATRGDIRAVNLRFEEIKANVIGDTFYEPTGVMVISILLHYVNQFMDDGTHGLILEVLLIPGTGGGNAGASGVCDTGHIPFEGNGERFWRRVIRAGKQRNDFGIPVLDDGNKCLTGPGGEFRYFGDVKDDVVFVVCDGKGFAVGRSGSGLDRKNYCRKQEYQSEFEVE